MKLTQPEVDQAGSARRALGNRWSNNRRERERLKSALERGLELAGASRRESDEEESSQTVVQDPHSGRRMAKAIKSTQADREAPADQKVEVILDQASGAPIEYAVGLFGMRWRTKFAPDMGGGGGAAVRRGYTKRGRLRDAGLHGLPGGKSSSTGPYRYRPPKGYKPGNELPRGPNNGYLDRFGNEWVEGPYHGDPKLGFAREWDVQLSESGSQAWGDAANGSSYINVRPDGYLSH